MELSPGSDTAHAGVVCRLATTHPDVGDVMTAKRYAPVRFNGHHDAPAHTILRQLARGQLSQIPATHYGRTRDDCPLSVDAARAHPSDMRWLPDR